MSSNAAMSGPCSVSMNCRKSASDGVILSEGVRQSGGGGAAGLRREEKLTMSRRRVGGGLGGSRACAGRRRQVLEGR